MRAFLPFAAFFWAACSGAARDPIPPAQLDADRERFFASVARDHAENARTFLQRIAKKARERPDEAPVLDILALSGGGANGAFGTGFLRGWGEIEEGAHQRPDFDIVTGISTGALIAPFAFAGTDERYREIDELYRNPGESWAVKRSGAVLFGGPSLLDADGLWTDLRRRVDAELVAELARGRREHRMMLIGTIDADLGLQRVWNGAELAIDAEARGDAARLHDVLVASASYPGAFPAVEIDGHLHIDGGMGSLFVAGVDSLWLERAAVAWQKRFGDAREPPRVRVWIVLNARLRVPATTVAPTWLGTMGRGLDVGTRISSQVLIGGFINGARQVSLRTGWPIEVRYTAIPDHTELPAAKSAFDPAVMRALSEIGRALGKDPASWRTDVPETEWPSDVDLPPRGEGE